VILSDVDGEMLGDLAACTAWAPQLLLATVLYTSRSWLAPLPSRCRAAERRGGALDLGGQLERADPAVLRARRQQLAALLRWR
jgi:hypothetical protein